MPGLCVSSKSAESFVGRRDRRLGGRARHGHGKGTQGSGLRATRPRPLPSSEPPGRCRPRQGRLRVRRRFPKRSPPGAPLVGEFASVSRRPSPQAAQVVRYGRPPDSPTLELEARPRAAHPTPTWTWALMRRVFDLDVLACPRCGGRLRVIATVQDPAVVRAILAHLGLAPAPIAPARPRPRPSTPRPPGNASRPPRGALRGLPDPRRRPPPGPASAPLTQPSTTCRIA
jgi:hypothetical protein